MYNYNFGGIKGASPEGYSVAQRTREGWGASERTITDGFRAYSTAEEGARDYLGLLSRRYGAALDSARAGDVGGFVRGLKAKGYFTGNESAYTHSVGSLARQHLRETVGTDEGLAPPALAMVPLQRSVTNNTQPQHAMAGSGSVAGAAVLAEQWDVPPVTVDTLLSFNDAIDRAALRIAGDSYRRDG